MRWLIASLAVLALPTGVAAQTRSAAPALERWRVSPEPTFDSRRSSGGDSVILLHPRGVHRLPDGTIVVGDDGARNVKWFAHDARLIRTVGREGEGPGEFQLVQLVGSCGSGAILVYDAPSKRLTRLSPEGKVLGTRLVLVDEPERRVVYTMTCGPSSGLVILTYPSGSFPNSDIAFRSTMELRMQSIEGKPSRLLGTFLGPEQQRFDRRNIGPRPLGKRTQIAVGSDRIFVGTGDAPVVEVLTLQGVRLPPLQLPFVRDPISKRDVREYIEGLIARNPDRAPARIRADYESLEYPAFFPAHGELIVDSEDCLWVEQYRAPGEETSRWVIIGRSGRLAAEITLPAGVRASEVGRDYVLGTWRGEDEVLYVRMHRLERPGGRA